MDEAISVVARPSPDPYRGGTTIQVWDPEDRVQWETVGRSVARRNLWVSIAALFLAFAVWMVWSTIATQLPTIGFQFTTDQLFWLVSLPGLSGAALRIVYAFLVPVFGGRRWTVISTASLLVPAIGIGIAVQSPATPYWVFLVLSLLSGFGGGNFASSMANISFFYPKASKGTALGLNAGLGNLGVSAVQLISPLVLGVGALALGASQSVTTKGGAVQRIWAQNAAFVWVVPIAVVVLLAAFTMNDLATARASFREQSIIFSRRHTWVMCWVYTGTFGSFIGFSAGFPLLLKTAFPASASALAFAFLGPLVGALMRPVGGWLSDKLGGARVTLGVFFGLVGGTATTIVALQHRGQGWGFGAFFASFVVLFALTGIGNGSVFRMVPVMFQLLHDRGRSSDAPAERARASREAGRESAAVLGFISAIAAFGAFLVPKSFGWSMAASGSAASALIGFIAFYVVSIGLTWWFYARRGAEAPC